ncbi:MAG: hypothetical protein GPOALKHO_001168 [Sodalis sp.]|nr:MAG: hypothetical protein GPOALKHO_001168 [Sodalis sp.]
MTVYVLNAICDLLYSVCQAWVFVGQLSLALRPTGIHSNSIPDSFQCWSPMV